MRWRRLPISPPTSGAGNQTVTLDGNQTVGQIAFANSTSGGGNYDDSQGTSGTLTLDNNATGANIYNYYGANTISAPVSLNDNLAANIAGGSLSISNTIGQTGTRSLTKTGTGTLTLSGANSLTGNISVNEGTLAFATGLSLSTTPTINLGDTSGTSAATIQWSNNSLTTNNALVVRSGSAGTKTVLVNTSVSASVASLELNDNLTKDNAGTLSVTGTTTLKGGGTRTLNVNSGTLTLTGAVGQSGGTGNLIKTGGGTLNLTAARGYTGTTTVNGGTLNLGSGWNTASVNSLISGLTGTSGTIGIDTGGGSIVQTAAWNLGSLGLTKNGSNMLTLDQANTLSGNVVVNAGTLRIAHKDALGTTDKTVDSRGGSRVVELSGGITLGAHISFIMSSNSGDGQGLSSVSGNNFIEGKIDYSYGLGALNISSSAGSTLTINGNVQLIEASRGITFGGASTNANTVNGVISSNDVAKVLSVTKQGVGTWVLANGNNSYTGTTTLSGGILSVGTLANGGSNSGIGASTSDAANLVFNGGTLRYTGASVVSDRAFTITADKTATIDVTTASADFSLAGATGTATTGALTKTGSGTLTLTGTNTYTGDTTVSQGKLLINGNISTLSTTTVKSPAPSVVSAPSARCLWKMAANSLLAIASIR